jgi:hypothetical protein
MLAKQRARWSMERIACWLNHLGVRTPGGGKISRMLVWRILSRYESEQE